jgi:hypothetical protein
MEEISKVAPAPWYTATMSDIDRPSATNRDESRQRDTLSLDDVMKKFDGAQMLRT